MKFFSSNSIRLLDYSKIYLFFGGCITLLIVFISNSLNLITFNSNIQFVIAGIYGLNIFLLSVIKSLEKYALDIVFYNVSLTTFSVAFILYNNNFSGPSFLVFLIVMICMIFTINNLRKFVFFYISFSIIYFSLVFFSKDIIVGIEAALLTYILLLLISFFIVVNVLNTVFKLKTKNRVFNQFFKYSSDFMILAKISENKIIINDINNSLLKHLKIDNKDFYLETELEDFKLKNIAIFKPYDWFKPFNEELIEIKVNEETFYRIRCEKYELNWEKYLFFSITDISDITLKDQYNQMIIESYKHLFHNSSEFICVQDIYGVIIDINKSLTEKLGYDKEEIIGKTVFYLSPNEELNKRIEVNKEVFETNKSQIFIKNIEAKNGLIIPFEVILRKGKYFGVDVLIATSRDISNRLKIENELANSVKRFYNLFKKAPFGMLITSKNGEILDCNQAFIELIGYSEIELKEINFNNITFLEDKGLNDNEYQQLWNDEIDFINIEKRYVKKDGSIIHAVLKVIKEEDENGIAFRNLAQIVDITELKNTELILTQKQETLDLTIESSKTILWDLDLESGDAVWRNVESITGIKGTEIVVNPQYFQELVHPEDYSYVRNSIKYVINSKQPYHIDFRFVCPDGSIKWINSRGQVKLDKEHTAIHIYGTMHDITDKKESERILEKSEETYRLLFERNLAGVFRSSIDGRILACNSAFSSMLSFENEEEIISSKNAFSFYRTAEERKNLIDKLVKNDFVKSERQELVTKDGKSIHVFLNASIIYNSKKEMEYIEGNIIDITDLVTAEKLLQESKEQYKALIDNSNYGIIILNNKKLQFINEKGLEIIKYKTPFELMYKSIEEIVNNECEAIHEAVEKIENGEKVNVFENKVKDKEGNILDFEFRANHIKFQDKESVLLSFIDITTKKQIEEEKNRAELAEKSNELLKVEIEERISIENKLTVAQSYSAGIIESSIDMIYTADKKGKINEFNLAASIEFQYLKKELIGESLHVLFGSYEERIEIFKTLEESNQFVGEVLCKRKDGTVFISFLSISYLYNTKKAIIGIMIIGRNITELKENELILKLSEDNNNKQAAKLKAVIESSSHYFFTINNKYLLTSYNENYYNDIKKITGKKIIIGDSYLDISVGYNGENYANFWKDIFDKAFQGEIQQFEIKREDEKGNSIFREIFINPIIKEDGKVDEISGIGHDITEKKIAEKKLKESLIEKEVLLKEIHHRVKNNMQVISSILNLQSAYVKDQQTLNILKESQNRIKSMAFIHESLYTTKDFSKINFSEYITNLCQNLFRTYEVYEDRISLELDIQDFYLNLDLAIPCGLIINELISNILKYAFEDNQKGLVKITLTIQKKIVTLLVSDNGKGIPESVDIYNTETLGLQLINSLVEQIDGKLFLSTENGAEFKIQFLKD